MNHPILGAIALGYTPLIDRQRIVGATRLTVVPLRPDAPLEASELLAAVAEVWPAGGNAVILNVINEGLLNGMQFSVSLHPFDGYHASAGDITYGCHA